MSQRTKKRLLVCGLVTVALVAAIVLEHVLAAHYYRARTLELLEKYDTGPDPAVAAALMRIVEKNVLSPDLGNRVVHSLVKPPPGLFKKRYAAGERPDDGINTSFLPPAVTQCALYWSIMVADQLDGRSVGGMGLSGSRGGMSENGPSALFWSGLDPGAHKLMVKVDCKLYRLVSHWTWRFPFTFKRIQRPFDTVMYYGSAETTYTIDLAGPRQDSAPSNIRGPQPQPATVDRQ